MSVKQVEVVERSLGDSLLLPLPALNRECSWKKPHRKKNDCRQKCLDKSLLSLRPFLKDTLSCLRQFLATETPLKMMKNAFYFTSKALFVRKIFKFFSWFFGLIAKRLDQKDKVNFKFYNVTAWLTNNCNTHIAQYLQK